MCFASPLGERSRVRSPVRAFNAGISLGMRTAIEATWRALFGGVFSSMRVPLASL